MRVIVDGFGGDNAPGEILLGCARAMEELGIDISVAGDKDKLLKSARELGLESSFNKMEVLHCTDVLSMEDEPDSILKAKSGSSMAVGMRALSEGRGDAFASAGNSGALTERGVPGGYAAAVRDYGLGVHGEGHGGQEPQGGPCERGHGGA